MGVVQPVRCRIFSTCLYVETSDAIPDEFTGGIREILFLPVFLVTQTCVVTGAEKLSLDDVDEIRDTKTTNHSVAGWRTVQSQEGIVRRASLGQFDRFPVSGEPVSADGTLTPAVLRNRHTHTHTRVYIYRERCRPDRVIYTGNCGKNGPCTRLESCHRSERRVIWSER